MAKKEEETIKDIVLCLNILGLIFVLSGALTRNLAMVIAGIFLAIIK